MARGDSIFGRVDVDWFEGEKTSQLTPLQRDFYINGLWLYAIKLRRDTIPVSQARVSVVARNVHILRQTCYRHLHKLDTIGLITINADKSITIHGIKEVNRKIKWKPCPIRGPNGSPDFPHTVPYEDIDRREEVNSSSPRNSFITKTSSAFDHQTPENPEVFPEGEPNPDPPESSPPSTKKDTQNNQHPNPDPITSLAKFKLARPSTAESIHSLAFEVITSLSLPDEYHLEAEDIVAGYPVAWTRDCILTTRDKQQRIAEGTDKTGFTEGPLQYLAGSLMLKLKALKARI